MLLTALARIGMIGVALSFAPLAISDAAQVPRVTILDLKRSSNRYDQRVVRLRGQFDQCAGATCNFCPEDMTTATADVNRCLPLGFRTGGPLAGVPSENIAFAHRQYRFATVTIEATFTSVCLSDENGKTIGDILCTGWPANLYAPRILEVHSRKSANDGLITPWGDVGALIDPPPEDQEAMLKELKAVLWFDNVKVFSIQLDSIAIENKRRGDPYVTEGLGCVCSDGSCIDKWPTRAFYGMNSPSNPFECWFMQKQDGGWRVIPWQY